MPTQATVKQHITKAVRKADLTSVSAKQIRRSVEKELDLAENALSNETWKALVKEWILDATVAIERGDVETDNEDVKEVEEEEIGRSLCVCGADGSAKGETEEGCYSGYTRVVARQSKIAKAVA
jgi:hypothetical protein